MCVLAPAGDQVSLTRRGGVAEPPPTARMPPQPSAASCSSSQTLISSFGAPLPLVSAACAATTASAKTGGFRSLAGRFTHWRVAFTASATSRARSKAWVAPPWRAIGESTTLSLGAVFEGLLARLLLGVGRASVRERVCQYGWIQGGRGSLT